MILIGNELLSGRVQDANLHYLAGELWDLGCPVARVLIVRDIVDEIAEATRTMSDLHRWVFTTGGIGPTHDDVTIEGVARAFDTKVIGHRGLEKRLREHFGERITEAHLRMARIPEGAVLTGADPEAWPTVRMKNVFIFAGIPAILRRKFPEIREELRSAPIFRETLFFRTAEAVIADTLHGAAQRFPDIEIGSYPQTGGEADTVQVTLEGADQERLRKAVVFLEQITADIERIR